MRKKDHEGEQMNFEEALKKLEKIVADLETGDVALEKSIQKFEEGMKLVKLCNSKLQEIERKIEIVIKDKKGNLKKKPFKDEAREEELSEEDDVDESRSEASETDDEFLF